MRVLQKQNAFERKVLKAVLDKTYLMYIPEYNVYSKRHGIKRVDFYIPTIKLAIEFDENYHLKIDQIKADRFREKIVREILHCDFIRFSEFEPLPHAARRLEERLREKGVRFAHQISERDYLISRIRNCERKIEELPDLFDFYYERLQKHKRELKNLGIYY